MFTVRVTSPNNCNQDHITDYDSLYLVDAIELGEEIVAHTPLSSVAIIDDNGERLMDIIRDV